MYRFLRGIGRIIYIFRHWQVIGRENIPPSGGVIIAANHSSAWDPILLGCAIDREIHYMSKEELFSHSLAAWFLSRIHAFPVNRGAVDRRAIRKAMDLLQSGEVVGIFPEGTRVVNGQEVEPHSGVALLALKSKVPVVPVGLKGSRSGIPRAIIGEPIGLEQYYDMKLNSALLETISKNIMNEINRLVNSLGDSGA